MTDENINIDDITFDDVIAGDGLESADSPEGDDTGLDVDIDTGDNELEADAAAKAEKAVDPVLDTDKNAKEDDLEEDSGDADSDEEDDNSGDDLEEETVVGDVLKTFGYEFEDEFDDTTEGLTKMTKAVAGKLAEEQLDGLFESFPLIKDHLDYVLNGGDSQQFMKAYDPSMDYAKLNISEKDIRSQKAILTDYFKTKGHEDDFILEILEDYEDGGKLFSKAGHAQKAMSSIQAKERQELVEKQKAQRVSEMKEQQQFWDGVHEKIDKSQEFAGITVPEREKKKFFNYLSQPIDKDGRTQRDKAHSEASMDVQLAIDYLMFKGFNLDQIIDKKATTKKARSLKSKIRTQEASIKSAQKAARNKKSGNVDDLDLSLF